MYQTYIMGSNANLFYDQATLDQLKANMPLFFKPPYFSTWRILHIDGFEPMYWRLPARTGYKIQFCASPKLLQSSQFCGGE